MTELEAFERANIVRALETAAWKVSGADGAAALLQAMRRASGSLPDA